MVQTMFGYNRILACLERVFHNNYFLSLYNHILARHLGKFISDYSPLLLNLSHKDNKTMAVECLEFEHSWTYSLKVFDIIQSVINKGVGC